MTPTTETSKVASIDAAMRLITLENGNTIKLADSADPKAARVGDSVTMTYDDDAGVRTNGTFVVDGGHKPTLAKPKTPAAPVKHTTAVPKVAAKTINSHTQSTKGRDRHP